MNKRMYSLFPLITIIFNLVSYSYGQITIDTYNICVTIAISAMAIILALAKNDKETKDKK